ncbi:MAG: hypothetical protein FD161_3125 [Limisphaerales bacterium]|nr:MAG: hypothetical protein FD161_3125 [Limisphaerales bacterium]KAG0508034.1 MAG: hypothetical protein E1N63_2832 [Limisphaerales bacterium]TXT50431.1 MAG: hypothetical protein FD140_2354 [Limisphaerales bacterium]
MKSQTMSWALAQTTTTTNAYDALDVADLTETSSYVYRWGDTYTNYWSQQWLNSVGYGTNLPGTGPGTFILQSTNAASAPWGTVAPATGTLRDYGLQRHHTWVNSEWIEDNVYEPWDWTDTNYVAVWNASWVMGNWSYSLDEGGLVETQTYSIVSEAELLTSGTNGDALFCLTGSVNDVSSGTGVPLTNGWKLAGLTPDADGRVFKVYGNGTTNDVTVALDSSLTNSVTNWNYSVSAGRVDLTLQWLDTSTTNWRSDPLYVLKDTTVTFRVATSVNNVTWPSGLPTWSHGGTAGATTVNITFNAVSGTTNGEWVSVTAGTTASNQVVVFDYSVKFLAEAPGAFLGRATNPTTFGVGEGVVLWASPTPSGLTSAQMGEMNWSVTGMSLGTPSGDRSIPPAAGSDLFIAGAFVETNTAKATIAAGLCAGSTRSNQFSIIRPSSAVLRDVLVVWTNQSAFFSVTNSFPNNFVIAYTNVGHTENVCSAQKRASYFLLPADVSFHAIYVREGAGPYHYNSNVHATNGLTQQVTFSNGTNKTWTFPPVADHQVSQQPGQPWHPFMPPTNILDLTGPAAPNHWATDTYGEAHTEVDPYSVAHQRGVIATLTGSIPIEFSHRSGNWYTFYAMFSERKFYTDGAMQIEKIPESGPHFVPYDAPGSQP